MTDDKDLKIIKELKKNSRQKVTDIAKTLKMRGSTVHLRIQKLLENKVIEKFSIKTNDEKLKENFTVFILVNTEKDIPDEFFKKYSIKESFGITGEYDIILKCKFADINEFNKFILEFRKLEGIKKTLTMVSTTKIKEEF
ncbi:MAG: Lrp/AsnC family transcriptional regulator [archaeon]